MKNPRPPGGYDPEALRRLNRASIHGKGPGISSDESFCVEIRTTNTGSEKKGEEGEEKREEKGKRVERADGLLWLGEGYTLRGPGFEIVSPMIYASPGRIDLREPSCVYTHLPVDDLPPAPLGYWPSFSDMTSSQRGYYLRWLADGKRGALDDIGYAFVYFYGLERRALAGGQYVPRPGVPRVDVLWRDVLWVIEETRRLLLRCAASRSFRKYAGGLLVYLFAKYLAEPEMTEERLLDLHGFLPIGQKTTFPLLLAWYALHCTALSPGQALYVLSNLPAERSGQAGKKSCSAEESLSAGARKLFGERYLRAYPSGFSFATGARPLRVGYGTASAALMSGKCGSFPPDVEIPNVLGKSGQFRKLREIWASCREDAESGELVRVRRAGKRVPGEALRFFEPGGEPEDFRKAPPEVRIDMERAERLMRETESLARTLAAVFGGEENRAEGTEEPGEKEKAAPAQDKESKNAPVFPEASKASDGPLFETYPELPFGPEKLRALDAKYFPVLRALFEKQPQRAEDIQSGEESKWSREEWQSLSRRYGFMPNALIEALNTWAEETLGDFLLFEEDGAVVLDETLFSRLFRESGDS